MARSDAARLGRALARSRVVFEKQRSPLLGWEALDRNNECSGDVFASNVDVGRVVWVGPHPHRFEASRLAFPWHGSLLAGLAAERVDAAVGRDSVEPGSKRGSAGYVAGNRAAYNEQKERWAESLIRRAEELVIPGLSSMIETKLTASPLTNWAFTGNPEGAIQSFPTTHRLRSRAVTPWLVHTRLVAI